MSSTQTPIDLTVANRIARGSSQKRWLAEALTPAGLNPTDGKHGRYSRALWRRIEAFVGDLALAGYATQELPLAPGGNCRVVITGYVPAAAPLLAALRANPCKTLSSCYRTATHCELLAWVEDARPEVVRAATTLAPWFTGSLEDLLAVAPGVALGQVTTHVAI